MSNDQRRFNGIDSTPYHVNARCKTKTYEEKIESNLPKGKRKDGREFGEARKLCNEIQVKTKHQKHIHNYLLINFRYEIRCNIKSKRFSLY